MRRVLCLLLIAACKDPQRTDLKPASEPGTAAPREPGAVAPPESGTVAPPEPGTVAPTRAPGKPASARADCVDAQLAARHLNAFGDPPDTAYAGGTPLFDERTGRTSDRIEAVLSKHPWIALACDRPDAAH